MRSEKAVVGMMMAANGRSGRFFPLVVAVVLLAFAATAAFAQDEGDAPAAEPNVREGVWVDFFFGTGLDRETRTVTGAASTFAPDAERIYCLTRVHGMRPPASVTHAWYYEGRTMARVDLTIGSENWRTWSSKSLLPAWTGHWEVKVLDEDGMVLGSAGFEVE